MALEPVSVALKFGFLAVLYLFLLWVARSALKDLRRQGHSAQLAAAPPEATGLHSAVGGGPRDALLVVERAPGHERGARYDVGHGATLGRGDVEVVLEDAFASSQHARIERQGGAVVLEDLGSTNGTYLNDELLRGPQPLHPGDRIRIGDSHFVFHG
ncbi:MAG TPA: FHA domain-containing protein [Solirubrobacteraceae bacterium]|nr:FHA domain-containing protein [Solirubrobacteraceae bacterium]